MALQGKLPVRNKLIYTYYDSHLPNKTKYTNRTKILSIHNIESFRMQAFNKGTITLEVSFLL
jgi:hypothetical protein